MKGRALFIAGLISAAFLVFAAPSAHALLFSDDFNDNSINTSWWTVGTSGSGNSVIETNSRLEMTQGSSGYGYLQFNYPIVGDFKASVDYVLLGTWSNNKERLAINAEQTGPLPGAVERLSDTGYGGEAYLTHFPDGISSGIATTDTTGTLGIERVGSTLSGSYWNANTSSWVLIHSDPLAGTANAVFKLQMWPLDMNNSPQGIQAAFDNFRLDAPYTKDPNPVVPEPATMAIFGLGLAGLTRVIKKRRHE